MLPDRFQPRGELFINPKGKESLSPINAGKMSLLVHPLFATGKTMDPDSELFLKVLQRRFIPRAADEVTGVMYPYRHVDSGGCQEELVVPSLQSATSFPSGVIEIQDIVLGHSTLDDFFAQFKQAGFLITPQTTITIGGEWVNNCVFLATTRLIQDSRINRLRLDKQGVRGPEAHLLENYMGLFRDGFKKFSLSENEEYIEIAKNPPISAPHV